MTNYTLTKREWKFLAALAAILMLSVAVPAFSNAARRVSVVPAVFYTDGKEQWILTQHDEKFIVADFDYEDDTNVFVLFDTKGTKSTADDRIKDVKRY
jgi:hypothetical protein